MSRESSEKYKLFRNYMTNELGVTRADIEKWTKESVAVEVNKKLGQLNIDDMVKSTIKLSVQNCLSGYSYNTSGLRDSIAKELVAKLSVTVKS
jgi:hypothetical protein